MTTSTDLLWEERPWGGFFTVYSTPQTTVKVLRLNPHSAISLQYHEERSEFWTLLTTDALVKFTINGQVLTAEPAVRYYVPRQVIHRIHNLTQRHIEVLEVIEGRYDENDIVRIHDNYGR